MASYRQSRWFPKRSGFAIIVLALCFVVYHLMFSNKIASPASSESTDPRIAIVTFTTRELSYTHLSLKNKSGELPLLYPPLKPNTKVRVVYARRHGYDLIVDYDANEPRGTMWHKFVMIEEAMATQRYDWIWWIDFDTLITNTTIRLGDIIEESLANHIRSNIIDFLFTADCFQLNAGSMIVRSRPSAAEFLNRVRVHNDDHKDLSEQDCIRDVVNENVNGIADQALWIPQWKINAFPEEIKCWDEAGKGWEKGVFLVHFAGAWAHLKEEDPTGYLMRKYENEIIWS